MTDLVLHPDMRCDAALKVSATVQASEGGRLLFTYRVEGDLARVDIPAPKPAQRTDFLWQHTCFEGFIARLDGPAYHELNLSPSGEWAIYGFRDYRDIESIGEDAQALSIRCETTASSLLLRAEVDLHSLSPTYKATTLRIGVNAVIEERNGNISYWALRHPPGIADFHHADNFGMQLQA